MSYDPEHPPYVHSQSNQQVQSQDRKPSGFRKAVGAALSFLLGCGVIGFVWNNGGEAWFCSTEPTRRLTWFCPQQLDSVTQDQAEAYAERLTVAVDSGASTDDVYKAHMKPAEGATKEADMADLAKAVGRVDHAEYLGNVTRLGNSNTFTFDAQFWVTKDGYSFADRDRIKFHENLVDVYSVRVSLTAGSSRLDDVWSSLPGFSRDARRMYGTHDAPVMFATSGGSYYEDADRVGVRSYHGTAKMSAICYWVPDSAVNGNTITDSSKIMLKTYVGFVEYSNIKFQRGSHLNENGWPKNFRPCATRQ